jgi:glycosyltransferase involved in cell wall biosynthesis
MIHLVLREPIEYQKTLCQALSGAYGERFVVWFASKNLNSVRDANETFGQRFLPDAGYLALLRELKADTQAIVILGGWASPFAWLTLLMTWMLSVPIFIWADHPHPRRRRGRLRRLYLKLVSRRISGLLACGKPTVDHLATLGFDPNEITNFPYWVRVPEEWCLPPGCESNPTKEPIRLLAVGRLVPVKAFDTAIKAVALANEKAGEQIATLEVIGEGVERDRLEGFAKTVDAHGAIRFSGWLANDEVCRRITKSDALIVPSTFEPYGVVVLEALANGRAVLASDQVVAALDRDDASGAILFHSVADATTLARQIKMLAEDRIVLKQAACAARAIAEQWKPERAPLILNSALQRAQTRDGFKWRDPAEVPVDSSRQQAANHIASSQL